MRGAIPGREPHLLKKKRANKIPSKRWKHIKTHNENAIRSMEIYQKKRKKLNNYGYYTKKMENLETATPIFDGNMIIIPSTTIPNLVKNDIKFLFANISTTNINQDKRGNTTGTGGWSMHAGPQTNTFNGLQYPYKLNRTNENILKNIKNNLRQFILKLLNKYFKNDFEKIRKFLHKTYCLDDVFCFTTYTYMKYTMDNSSLLYFHIDVENIFMQINIIYGKFKGCDLYLSLKKVGGKKEYSYKDLGLRKDGDVTFLLLGDEYMIMIGNFHLVWHAASKLLSGTRSVLALYVKKNCFRLSEEVFQFLPKSFVDTLVKERKMEAKKYHKNHRNKYANKKDFNTSRKLINAKKQKLDQRMLNGIHLFDDIVKGVFNDDDNNNDTNMVGKCVKLFMKQKGLARSQKERRQFVGLINFFTKNVVDTKTKFKHLLRSVLFAIICGSRTYNKEVNDIVSKRNWKTWKTWFKSCKKINDGRIDCYGFFSLKQVWIEDNQNKFDNVSSQIYDEIFVSKNVFINDSKHKIVDLIIKKMPFLGKLYYLMVTQILHELKLVVVDRKFFDIGKSGKIGINKLLYGMHNENSSFTNTFQNMVLFAEKAVARIKNLKSLIDVENMLCKINVITGSMYIGHYKRFIKEKFDIDSDRITALHDEWKGNVVESDSSSESD